MDARNFDIISQAQAHIQQRQFTGALRVLSEIPPEHETSTTEAIRQKTTKMASEQSRQKPAFFIFLLDQSGSMIDPIGGGGGKSKEEALAETLNAWIEMMIFSCANADGINNKLDVSIIGYCTDENGEAIIEPALAGALAGRERVSIIELEENVARVEDRTLQRFDENTEAVIEIPYEHKVWVEPRANFGTPMCSALLKVYELIESWTAENMDSSPPIVINFSDGESTDANPLEYAESVLSHYTHQGNVLMFNCHMSIFESGGVLFPSTASELPLHLDPNAQTLFDISSELPKEAMESGLAMGFDLSPGARGLAFNADLVGIMKFLQMVASPPGVLPKAHLNDNRTT